MPDRPLAPRVSARAVSPASTSIARQTYERPLLEAAPGPKVDPLTEARNGLQLIAAKLRRQETSLRLLIADLRQHANKGEGFDPIRELAEGAECVRNDLLADAIETLYTLATLDDEHLRIRSEERFALLAGL